MADSQAQHIVNTALRLRQQNRSAHAIDVLDQAMHWAHPEYDDHTGPASKFGELLRQAFAPKLDVLCDERAEERWQVEVIDAFALPYQLWHR